ncbi:MAG: type II toxin-antitoxin system RelE/ParE family toxin [Rickettsiales bacterium]|nr:type II toxin-antitoxin system RelE/ParE family toxin [Rickettsiales bacterium]
MIKKLYANEKICVDNAIKTIINDFNVRELKNGDLNNVRVYKFRILKQLTLLAYYVDEINFTIILIHLGSHENFYNNLKKILKN